MNAKDATPEKDSPSEAAQASQEEATAVDDSTAATEASSADAPAATESAAADGATAEATGQTGEVQAAPVQTVYVTAPTPPRRKGNRGLGVALAIVATVVFAAAYAGVALLLILFVNASVVSGAIGAFVVGPLFYVPVLAFLVFMIVWALLVNRASWWAWVIGSLVIAALTYFGSIGVLLLMSGGFGLTGSQAAATFVGFAINPALIAATLLARETSIWFGAAIAKRGRRVRERNYEAWQEFENEEARKRAELGGVAAV
ncbi:MAG: hypothetical protein KF801_05095 [Cryobacterium sp.]|nr:hypothetical protein [Cryobacterium sp.]